MHTGVAAIAAYDHRVMTALRPVRWFRDFGRPPRILGLDVARGLAILGMAGAHVGVTEAFEWGDPTTWTDLVHGRSSILFALLAGVSIALMTGRDVLPERERLPSIRLNLVGRGAVIFVIGLALELLNTPIAVILTLYGLLYVAVIPVLRWRPRRLLLGAAVLALAGPALLALLSAVALQPFEALAGFRPAARTIELLRALAVSDLDPFIDLLGGSPDAAPTEVAQSDADGLRALFTTWITAPQPDLDVLVPAVLEGAIQYLHSEAGEFAAEAKTVLELGERYPGDAGVLAALLLNRISLAPGEAIFLAAGNLHTYLQGVGLEVMANSDNVLRGGLTPKHVDVPELLRVLDFTPTTEEALRPAIHCDGPEVVYQTPAEEFAVSRLTLDGAHLGHELDAPAHHDGPQILLCTEGSVTVHAKSGSLTLRRGESAWVPSDDGPIRLRAEQQAVLFRSTIGL